jgi:hypothetical protein
MKYSKIHLLFSAASPIEVSSWRRWLHDTLFPIALAIAVAQGQAPVLQTLRDKDSGLLGMPANEHQT